MPEHGTAGGPGDVSITTGVASAASKMMKVRHAQRAAENSNIGITVCSPQCCVHCPAVCSMYE